VVTKEMIDKEVKAVFGERDVEPLNSACIAKVTKVKTGAKIVGVFAIIVIGVDNQIIFSREPTNHVYPYVQPSESFCQVQLHDPLSLNAL
jgi:hypothetical protein